MSTFARIWNAYENLGNVIHDAFGNPVPEDEKVFPPDPVPAEEFALPFDDENSLRAAYGAPIRPGTSSEKRLGWFDFPAGSGARLFSRQGAALTDHDGDGLPDHRMHGALCARFAAALQECFDEQGATEFQRQGLHVYCGAWNYRTKTGGSGFSTHAWGAAVDLNAGENPWKVDRCGFTDRTLDTFERHGFLNAHRAWRHDATHFQAAKFRSVVAGSYYAENGYPSNIT